MISSSKNQGDEKYMLQKLNQRLSCYIERLRKLEEENGQLVNALKLLFIFLNFGLIKMKCILNSIF